MNKIYKLVWSKVRNTWVVASEIAKGHGKSSSSEGNGKLLKSLVLTALLGSFMTAGISPVAAELTPDQNAVYYAVLGKLETEKKIAHYFSVNSTDDDADSNYKNDGAIGKDAVAIGRKAKAQWVYSTALGGEALAKEKYSTALGGKAVAEALDSTAVGGEALAKEKYSTALGGGALAEGGDSTALGGKAVAEAFASTALGGEALAKEKYSTAVGRKAVAEALDSTAVGGEALAKEKYSTAVGRKAVAEALASTALGGEALAQGAYSTALGGEALAKGHYSTAVGDYARAQGGYYSTALGGVALAEEDYSTAVGGDAVAKRAYSTALGGKAVAEAIASTALGNEANARREYSIAIGDEAVAEALASTALGHSARAMVDGSVALGNDAVALRKAGTVGYLASASGTTLDDVLTALDKKTDYDNWTATINASKAEYDRLTQAYFDASKWGKDVAKAALDEWKGQHKDFVDALEARARLEMTWKASRGAVSVGADGVDDAGNRIIESRQITNVAAGTEDTDAVNVAQLRNVATTPLNFYFGGTKDKTTNVYTPGTTNWSMPLNEFRMDFGDGLKAEQVTDKDGKKYTRVTLDKDSLKGDPAFKGDKGDNGGGSGKDGKSAYEVWKEYKTDTGEQPNKDKSEEDFFKSLKGEKGDPGTPGEKGEKGDPGTPGAPGEKGEKGDPGAKGDKGDPGAKGDKGDPGAKGDKGDPGAKGDKGDPGAKGDKGDPGAKGDKGDPGAKGDKGDPGAKGDKGDPGAKGDKGDPGAKGDKGDPGAKGDKGDPGAKGDKGDPGAKGDKGDPGAKGDKGDPGAKGDKGDPGAKGDKGADGKSAYEIWKNQTNDQGKQPNKDKSEQEFINSLKGKDGTGAGGGTDFTVTSDDSKADSNFKVDSTNPTLKIVGDKTNITTSIEKNNTVKVALNQDIKVNSVEVGTKDDKPGVKIDGHGINMNGKKIENLAPGTAPNDAATVGQVNEVRNESREGDALGAAMAALKPLDFDPYQRSQVMAGVGYYRGKEAVALGLAHYKNEDLMFHGGIAYAGSSELMANVGVSYRFGSKEAKQARNLRMPQYAEGPISSVYILQDEVQSLQRENDAIRKENADIREQNKEANKRIEQLEKRLDALIAEKK